MGFTHRTRALNFISCLEHTLREHCAGGYAERIVSMCQKEKENLLRTKHPVKGPRETAVAQTESTQTDERGGTHSNQ